MPVCLRYKGELRFLRMSDSIARVADWLLQYRRSAPSGKVLKKSLRSFIVIKLPKPVKVLNDLIALGV